MHEGTPVRRSPQAEGQCSHDRAPIVLERRLHPDHRPEKLARRPGVVPIAVHSLDERPLLRNEAMASFDPPFGDAELFQPGAELVFFLDEQAHQGRPLSRVRCRAELVGEMLDVVNPDAWIHGVPPGGAEDSHPVVRMLPRSGGLGQQSSPGGPLKLK